MSERITDRSKICVLKLGRMARGRSDTKYYFGKKLSTNIIYNYTNLKRNKKFSRRRKTEKSNSLTKYCNSTHPKDLTKSFFLFVLRLLKLKKSCSDRINPEKMISLSTVTKELEAHVNTYKKKGDENADLIEVVEEMKLFIETLNKNLIINYGLLFTQFNIFFHKKKETNPFYYHNLINYSASRVIEKCQYFFYYIFTLRILEEKLITFFCKFLKDVKKIDQSISDKRDLVACFEIMGKSSEIRNEFLNDCLEGRVQNISVYGDYFFEKFNRYIASTDLFSIRNKKVELKGVAWRQAKIKPNYDELVLGSNLRKAYNIKLIQTADLAVRNTFGNESKTEICRICEKRVRIKDYLIHIFDCLNNIINFQHFTKVKSKIDEYLKLLNVPGPLSTAISKENRLTFKQFESSPEKLGNTLAIIKKLIKAYLSNDIAVSKKPILIDLIYNYSKKTRAVLDIILKIEYKKTTRRRSTSKEKVASLLSPNVIIYEEAEDAYSDLTDITDKILNNKRKLSIETTASTRKTSNSSTGSWDVPDTCSLDMLKVKRMSTELKQIATEEMREEDEPRGSFSCFKPGVTRSSKKKLSGLVSENKVSSERSSIKDDDSSDVMLTPLIPSITDFTVVLSIAQGGYGRVDLCQKKNTGDYYALKTIKIKNMGDDEQRELLKNETEISNRIDNDFLVKTYYIFSTEANFYFVSEFMYGKDLLNLLNSYVLSFKTIQLIVAEILLGVQYLHENGVIHKDIKPENICISKNGHFKLTDFGISEMNTKKINDCINLISNISEELYFSSPKRSNKSQKKQNGTLYYMAPEMFVSFDLTGKVDYWSLGVVIFELFTLKTPFYSEDPNEVKENIKCCNINWDYFEDDEVSGSYLDEQLNNAKDLISKFLVIDMKERWGDNEINKIKSHPFFKNFNWETIREVKDFQVLSYVKKEIDKINIEIKKNKKNGIMSPLVSTENLGSKKDQREYHSERVDNIFKKCLEVILRQFNKKTK